MLKTLLHDENNRFLVIEDLTAISDIVKHKNRLLWLDVENPSKQEFEMIREEFGLHPLAIEDAMLRHQRPKVDEYESFYFVVFYCVEAEEAGKEEPTAGRRGLRGTRFHSGEEGTSQAPEQGGTDPANPVAQTTNRVAKNSIVLHELSMFLGSNYLITVHEDPIHEFDEVTRRWYRNTQAMSTEMDNDNDSVLGTRPLTAKEVQIFGPQARGMEMLPKDEIERSKQPDHKDHPDDPRNVKFNNIPDEVNEAYKEEQSKSTDIGVLLYSLLDTIVDGYFPLIDGIVDRVEDLEQEIFEQFNQAAIESIFSLKKDLLTLRKIFAPERDVLNVLTRRDIPIFEEHTLVYFQDIYDHVVRITDSIDTYRDLLSSALDSYLSMQSNRLNITVQTLTSVSIMLMSIATITGWYGMNFALMPELTSQFGYPGVMVLAVAIIAIEYFVFKRRGWL